MSCVRRTAGLLAALVAAAGCSKSPSPQPEAAAEAAPPPVADAASQTSAGPIRAGTGPAPVEPPPPPKPGEVTGTGPWPDLGAFPDPGHRSVAIPNVTGAVTGVAVNTAAGRAVVFEAVAGRPGGATRVILCDTAAGAIASEWEIKDTLVPLDLSPDGQRVLARVQSAPGTLVLLTVGDDLRLRRKSWAAHGPPESRRRAGGRDRADRSHHVNWAGFVSDTRLASCSVAGQLRVFDTTTAERVGFFEGVLGRPAVCPDGTRLLALCTSGLAVLDPAAGRVVAVRPFDPPPGEKVLAVSPDGKTVACAAQGRVALLDLASGDRWDALIPALGTGPDRHAAFGWVGTGHLLYGANLFDPAISVPVWRFDGAAGLAVVGPKVWAVTKPAAGGAKYAQGVHPAGQGSWPRPSATAGLEKPGAFALKAGAAVRVDVSGLPADKQAAVRAEVERNLARAGYRLDRPRPWRWWRPRTRRR